MNNSDNIGAWIYVFLGILGVFWFEYSVDPLFYGLSWLFIIGGAFSLYINSK